LDLKFLMPECRKGVTGTSKSTARVVGNFPNR
jgi:hypothetical protein